jgi:hypothetical protein
MVGSNSFSPSHWALILTLRILRPRARARLTACPPVPLSLHDAFRIKCHKGTEGVSVVQGVRLTMEPETTPQHQRVKYRETG